MESCYSGSCSVGATRICCYYLFAWKVLSCVTQSLREVALGRVGLARIRYYRAALETLRTIGVPHFHSNETGVKLQGCRNGLILSSPCCPGPTRSPDCNTMNRAYVAGCGLLRTSRFPCTPHVLSYRQRYRNMRQQCI